MGIMMVAVHPGIAKLFEQYSSDCLTPEQVAEATGLSTETIRRQLRAGKLPGYQLGTGGKASWRMVKSEVIAEFESRWNRNAGPDAEMPPALNVADSKE